MIGIAALVAGIVIGLVLRPSVPDVVQPYLPIAVVAALDAVFGGLRAYLEGIFDAKVFVISFVFNVLVAALIVYLGDQLGSGPSCRRRSSWCSVSGSSATPPPYVAGFSGPEWAPRRSRRRHPARPPRDAPGCPSRGRAPGRCSACWPRCCVCCSGSRLPPRFARPGPVTPWSMPGRRICWCCWIRCSSGRRR